MNELHTSYELFKAQSILQLFLHYV